MTPPATAAARSVHRHAPGSRRGAVRHPRRISGPARPVRAGAVAVAMPGIALPRERPLRPAAPARRRPARKTARTPAGAPGVALRAIGAVEGISSSAVLDRLVRGRVWIGLLAFALIGIVAMQLVVLQLNTGIGRTLAREALLQREIAQTGIEDSTASAGDQIEPLAAAAGMSAAPPGTIHFVAVSPSDVTRATAAFSAAVQAPASGLPGSSAARSGLSGSIGVAGGEPATGSGVAARTTTATGETAGSAEGGGSPSRASAGREGGAGSSEAQSTANSGTSTSASAAGPSAAASTPAATPPSGAGAQATGASAAPSSGTAASGPGGGTQAGPRE